MATLDLTDKNFAVKLLSYYLWGKTENFTAQVKFKKSFNVKFGLNFEFKFPWIASKTSFSRNDSKFRARNFKVVDCHEFC